MTRWRTWLLRLAGSWLLFTGLSGLVVVVAHWTRLIDVLQNLENLVRLSRAEEPNYSAWLLRALLGVAGTISVINIVAGIGLWRGGSVGRWLGLLASSAVLPVAMSTAILHGLASLEWISPYSVAPHVAVLILCVSALAWKDVQPATASVQRAVIAGLMLFALVPIGLSGWAFQLRRKIVSRLPARVVQKALDGKGHIAFQRRMVLGSEILLPSRAQILVWWTDSESRSFLAAGDPTTGFSVSVETPATFPESLKQMGVLGRDGYQALMRTYQPGWGLFPLLLSSTIVTPYVETEVWKLNRQEWRGLGLVGRSAKGPRAADFTLFDFTLFKNDAAGKTASVVVVAMPAQWSEQDVLSIVGSFRFNARADLERDRWLAWPANPETDPLDAQFTLAELLRREPNDVELALVFAKTCLTLDKKSWVVARSILKNTVLRLDPSNEEAVRLLGEVDTFRLMEGGRVEAEHAKTD